MVSIGLEEGNIEGGVNAKTGGQLQKVCDRINSSDHGEGNNESGSSFLGR